MCCILTLMPWILVGVCFASGKHCHPYSEHFVSLYSCFRDSAAFEATPADTPASETILGLSGEDTEMSKSVQIEFLHRTQLFNK